MFPVAQLRGGRVGTGPHPTPAGLPTPWLVPPVLASAEARRPALPELRPPSTSGRPSALASQRPPCLLSLFSPPWYTQSVSIKIRACPFCTRLQPSRGGGAVPVTVRMNSRILIPVFRLVTGHKLPPPHESHLPPDPSRLLCPLTGSFQGSQSPLSLQSFSVGAASSPGTATPPLNLVNS